MRLKVATLKHDIEAKLAARICSSPASGVIGKAPGHPDLYPFAAITDEPPAEIAETGHQRVIISLKKDNIDRWLSPFTLTREEMQDILSAKQKPRYAPDRGIVLPSRHRPAPYSVLH